MPTRERVQAFVTMVEAGDYVRAIRDFYTDDATMQENLGEIRAGRDALAAAEEKILQNVKSITTRPGSTFAIDGDRVIVHWVFDIEPAEGKSTRSMNSRTRPGAATASRASGSITIRDSGRRGKSIVRFFGDEAFVDVRQRQFNRESGDADHSVVSRHDHRSGSELGTAARPNPSFGLVL